MEVGENSSGAGHETSSPSRPTSSQLSLERTTGANDDGPLLSAAEGRASQPSSVHSPRSRAQSAVGSEDESDEEEKIAAPEQMHAILELSQNSGSFYAVEKGAARPSSVDSARSRMLSPVASGDESDEEERVAAQQQMHAMLEVAEEEDAKRVRVICQLHLNHFHCI